MKKELYLCGDKDLKITVDDNSDLIGVSFNCERLVTVTELMELEDWIHKVVKEKYPTSKLKLGCQKIQESVPVQLREENLTVKEVWESIPKKIQKNICLFLGGGPLKIGSLESLTEIQWRVVSFILTESVRKKWGDLNE